ncbi:MAG: L,D-transpeptidase [Vulcanimicrobiota bacterium]
MKLITPPDRWQDPIEIDPAGLELVKLIAKRNPALPFTVDHNAGKVYFGPRPEPRPPATPPPSPSKVRALMRPGDLHAVISGAAERAVLFDHRGAEVFRLRARCKGVYGSYNNQGGDTPPGLYRLAYYQPTVSGEDWATKAAYGWHFFDLFDVDRQERDRNREGCGWHGGGTAAPDPLAPQQVLVDTHGCIRSHNQDMDRLAAILKPFFPVQRGPKWFPDPDGPVCWASVTQPY